MFRLMLVVKLLNTTEKTFQEVRIDIFQHTICSGQN